MRFARPAYNRRHAAHKAVPGNLDSSSLEIAGFRPEIGKTCVPADVDGAVTRVEKETLRHADVCAAAFDLHGVALTEALLALETAVADRAAGAANHIDA